MTTNTTWKSVFDTDVATAVRTSLSSDKSLFILLTEHSDKSEWFIERYIDQSRSGSGRVPLDLIKNNFVCLRVETQTKEFEFFREIFRTAVAPSIYIMRKGQLLDVFTKENSADQLLHRIHSVVSGGDAGAEMPSHASYGAEPSVSAPRAECASTTGGSVLNPSEVDATSEEKRPDKTLKQQQADEQHSATVDSSKLAGNSTQRKKKTNIGLTQRNTQKDVTSSNRKRKRYDSCILSIKLFDGRSITKEFSPDSTLENVRDWLEHETESKELTNTSSSLPSFATSGYPQIVDYVFHSPASSRKVYTSDEERRTLAQLDLTPRSALILQKVYGDFPPTRSEFPSMNGIWNTVKTSAGKVCSAVYSFFDYGVEASSEIPAFTSLEEDNKDNTRDVTRESSPFITDHADHTVPSGSSVGNEISMGQPQKGDSTKVLSIDTNNDTHCTEEEDKASGASGTFADSSVVKNISSPSFRGRPMSPQPASTISLSSHVETIHENADVQHTVANKD
ncbi:Piso0_004847 [Millerozyma farinosa CBS 7064]|uniref:Piso0_004847 protein n=1 Tax=Pichia sorbitophila (strain ATCC MYA-4447 / BCRC 22081 / CBS 7064 / NBRC 10061 / NRRL Y-12695) TaxID=559304 RepID=G8Y0L0_PICSO|nr:Piso0_004847 [Millerozyma farinosa CBS 7064]